MKGKILQVVVDDFIKFIACEPLKGDVIEGTGGIRKIRWQINQSSGKSGGMRVLYYYHNQKMQIFLLTAYAKNQRANISAKDKKILKKLIKQIIQAYEENDDV